MKNPEIKLTFTADASQADKEIDKLEKKVEQLPNRIPLGQWLALMQTNDYFHR